MQNPCLVWRVSGIEALPWTRLYEAYLEKQWGAKQVSLKFGRLTADSEFFNTKYTDVFTNASMGWPAITSVNLPSGGPLSAAAAVGARLLVNFSEQLCVLGGIFDGDQGLGDPQERDFLVHGLANAGGGGLRKKIKLYGRFRSAQLT